MCSLQNIKYDFFSFKFSVLDSADCAVCEEALQNLEDIDDDADAVGVRMVKTDDSEFAQFMGITEFPAIVYYENGNPHIYDGDAREESELLTWILYQMKEDTIENINRDLLMKMILDYEYLGVFFCKSYISLMHSGMFPKVLFCCEKRRPTR